MTPPAITIPQLQRHLTLVQECFSFSTCIIAGGAVRDTLNRKAVKDIDVFIDLEEDPGPAVEKLSKSLYCDAVWNSVEGYNDRKGYGGVIPGDKTGAFLVCDLPNGIGDCPTQLIFLGMDPVENVRATFDFDISQAWVTRHRVWTTPACRRAMVEKQINYCPREKPNAQQRASSRDRLERLRAKYPEWKFNAVIRKD